MPFLWLHRCVVGRAHGGVQVHSAVERGGRHMAQWQGISAWLVAGWGVALVQPTDVWSAGHLLPKCLEVGQP